MSQNAVRFMVDLSQDPRRMEDYWQDPDAALEAAGLTAEEKEVIRSGDSGRLQALLGRPAPLLMSMTVFPKPKQKPKAKPKPQPKPQPKPKPKPKSQAA